MKRSVYLIHSILLIVFFSAAGSASAASEVRKGEARVTFQSQNFPPEAIQGTLLKGSIFFTLKSPLEKSEKVFLHLVKSGQKDVQINADFWPRYPTLKWEVGEIVEAGPVNLFIPRLLEPGLYDIKAGLFEIERDEKGVRFIREPYTDKGMADFTVGTIAVKEDPAAKDKVKKPAEVDLLSFKTAEDILFWEPRGASISIYNEGDIPSALVTIKKGTGFAYPGVALDNYFNIKPMMKDWSLYDALELNLAAVSKKRVRLFLQIQDKNGRMFKKEINLRKDPRKVVIGMVDLGGEVNIGNIDNLKLFVINPAQEVSFAVSMLRLISRGQATGQPIVDFVRLEGPQEVKRGELFKVRCYFKLNAPIFADHKMFVHMYRQYDQKGWIGVDVPLVPVIRQWPLNKEIGVDSAPLMISPESPPGTYIIRAGLYHIADSGGHGYVKMADWEKDGVKTAYETQPVAPLDYIKQPYTNPGIEDWQVGKIEVR